MEYYNLARLYRKAVLIWIALCFTAMVTGIWLPLHLRSHEHRQKHHFDSCPICLQLLVASKKFAVEPDGNLSSENY